MRTSLVCIALVHALTSTALAQEHTQEQEPPAPRWRPENYVGASLMGFAGFLRVNVGSYEVSYEHVFERHHGVRVAGDFIHVHEDAAHVQTHQWTFGGSLGYRYYFGHGVGPFVGASFGYRRGFGHYGVHHQPDHTSLANEQIRVIGQVGYRFFAERLALQVVPRVGIGYGEYSVWATDRDDAAGQAAARYSRDVLAPSALVIDLELTVGFGF